VTGKFRHGWASTRGSDRDIKEKEVNAKYQIGSDNPLFFMTERRDGRA
jgi:hypothetical protein